MSKNKQFDTILLIILTSYFIILLDNSIIFTGTVKIAQDLQMPQSVLSWVSNAYALTFGGLLLLGGKLGDLFDRKTIFTIGLVIFGVASLIVGFSQNAWMIIVSRALQGVGSAIIAPATLALILDNYEGKNRERAIGYYAATAGIGSSVGLILGGFFAQVMSWRVGFYINVPITIILIVLTFKYIQNKDVPKNEQVDYIGAITSVISMTTLTYSIIGEQFRLLALCIAIITFALFIYNEYKSSFALMPLSLFTDRIRIAGYLGRFLYLGAMFSFWFITPQIMQRVLGLDPLKTGIGFIPLTLIHFYLALKVVPLSEKFGKKKILITGVLITFIGMIMLAFFNESLGYWLGIMVPMLFLGAGQGLVLSPITSAGVANTNAELSGAASGVVNTLHQIGGSMGLAIVVAIASKSNNITNYYHTSMVVTSLFLLVMLIICLTLIPSKREF